MVLNATFNNISAISWAVSLLVEEPEYLYKTIDLPQLADKLYHIEFNLVHLAWARFELTTLVVIGTDCISSYKSNYLRDNSTVFEELEVSIVDLMIANDVLLATRFRSSSSYPKVPLNNFYSYHLDMIESDWGSHGH